MRTTLLLFLFLLGATSVREITTEQSIWDRILAEQAKSQTARASHALYFNSYQDAVRLLKKAVRSNPDDPVAHRQLGVALYWTGAVDDAVTAYLASLKLAPDDANTHQVLGIAYAWLGDIDSAQKEFETVLRLDPSRSDAHMNLGSIWDVKGSKEESIQHLKSAIRIDPDNPLYHFQLGSIYAKHSMLTAAIQSFTRALTYAPQYEDILLELGAAYEQIGEKEKSKSALRKALKIKPGDAVAQLLLSSLYRQEGNIDRVEKMHRSALSLTPGGDAHRLSLGVAFRGEKNDPAAADPLQQFRKNIERIPHDQGAQITVEGVFERRKELITSVQGVEALSKPVKEQLSGIKQMIELEPSSSEHRNEQINKFLDELKNALDRIPDTESLRLNLDIKQDQQSGRQTRKKNSDNKPKAVYQPRRVGNDAGLWVMGSAWMRIIDDLIIENLNKEPKSRLQNIELGIAYLQIGQADMAKNIFKKQISQSDTDVIAWQGMAVTYVELGEIEEAIACYNRILFIEPKNKIARESIKWLKE